MCARQEENCKILAQFRCVARIALRACTSRDVPPLISDGVLAGALPAGESWPGRAAQWLDEMKEGRRLLMVAEFDGKMAGMGQLIFRFANGYQDAEAANGTDIAMIDSIRMRPDAPGNRGSKSSASCPKARSSSPSSANASLRMTVTKMTRARATALLAGGAALGALPIPALAQAQPLHLATIALESASEVLYARDMGFLSKAGLDPDIQLMVNGTAIAAAIVSKSIDIGYVTLDALASIHQKGIPLVVVAPCTEYLSPTTTGALMVAADSAIHQAKDLNGKIIAVVALNGVTHLAIQAWMDQNGGDSKSVKYVELPQPSVTAALAAGRVDAAYAGEPFITMAKKTARVLIYGTDGIAKHYLSSAWIASPQWATDHPDVVNRFVSAIHETAVWATKNPAKAAELFAGYSKQDPAIVAATARVRFVENLTPALMQPIIDVSAKYNGFKSFPAQEIIYARPR
jgi:NitT/TauT family transport system substrate-binding protein